MRREKKQSTTRLSRVRFRRDRPSLVVLSLIPRDVHHPRLVIPILFILSLRYLAPVSLSLFHLTRPRLERSQRSLIRPSFLPPFLRLTAHSHPNNRVSQRARYREMGRGVVRDGNPCGNDVGGGFTTLTSSFIPRAIDTRRSTPTRRVRRDRVYDRA